MLDRIKDAVVARKLDDLRADFAQAQRSLERLLAQGQAWREISPETAWRLVHGIEASLSVAVATLKEARRSPGMPQGPARQAVTDMMALALHLEELLANHLIPLVERQFDLPPKGTRWRLEPPPRE